ncbi:MAG: DUF5694 domain-containing protein [Gilvibacter sp.]
MRDLFYAALSVLLLISCNNLPTETPDQIEDQTPEAQDKIKVLNFATFHMGYTSDAKSIEFDEYDKKNVDTIHQIAKLLAAFKPTVILVEAVPSYNDTLQAHYARYLQEPTTLFKNPDEVELLAFEVGRLAKVERIYGIDHKLSYNYSIGFEMTNAIDSVSHNGLLSNPFKAIPELNIMQEGLSLQEKLTRMNHPKFLDLLITVNADILTYVGTEEGFEGADEAAKYYQRNLRIYSNINRLKLKKEERVFILSGGSHTAFLREFMRRDVNYEMVDTFEFLK